MDPEPRLTWDGHRLIGCVRPTGSIDEPVPQMAFSHIGLYVTEMERMVSFYTRVLGFSVTDRARIRENL